jgi:hypothetical protein
MHVIQRIPTVWVYQDLATDRVLVLGEVVVVFMHVIGQGEDGEAVGEDDQRVEGKGAGFFPGRLNSVWE